VKKLLLGVALAFFALTLLGGYGLNWKWTGYADNGSVWDWLNLCLLPIAVAVVPLALQASTRLMATVAAVLTVVLGVLVIGGYALDWSWTGFPGNTLWDWLHLMLVPLALPFVAYQLGERQQRRRESESVLEEESKSLG
jgi:hypothetical protein